MRIRAIGRFLLVRMNMEDVDKAAGKTMIALPKSMLDKEKGGCQVATILSIGESAFDDEPKEVREAMQIGRQVITARYPGHLLGVDVLASDARVNEFRMISCSEVHGIVPTEGEEGADV